MKHVENKHKDVQNLQYFLLQSFLRKTNIGESIWHCKTKIQIHQTLNNKPCSDLQETSKRHQNILSIIFSEF